MVLHALLQQQSPDSGSGFVRRHRTRVPRLRRSDIRRGRSRPKRAPAQRVRCWPQATATARTCRAFFVEISHLIHLPTSRRALAATVRTRRCTGRTCGVASGPVATIRFYEKNRLLSEPPRSQADTAAIHLPSNRSRPLPDQQHSPVVCVLPDQELRMSHSDCRGLRELLQDFAA